MGVSCRLLVGGLLAYHSIQPVTAQNSTLPEHCDVAIRRVANNDSFNSTGSAEFQLAMENDQDPLQPWYLTEALRDVPLNDNGTRGTQALTIFLSVPESFVGSEQGNNTKFCTYRMVGQNATAADDGSCDKILSTECLKAIDDIPAMKDNDDDCPRPDIRDACGHVFTLSSGKHHTSPSNFSSSTCSVPSLPGTDIPDDYRTFTAIGAETLMLNPEPDEESYDMYSLRVRQPVPILVKARLGTSGSIAYQRHKMLCVAPSKVTQGSREPQGDFPPSSAVALKSGKSVAVALAVSLVVAGHIF